jgi:predicted ATPase
MNSIAITGYRSLYDVHVEPGDLTVLTGPNNSGKTNFVEALHFLAETYRHGLEVAISRKGGVENIIHRRMARTRRDLTFNVSATISGAEIGYRNFAEEEDTRPKAIHITHEFTIVPLSQRIDADYKVSHESASMRFTPRSGPFFQLNREADEVNVTLDESRLRRNGWLRSLMPPGSDYYRQVYSRTRDTDLMFNLAFSPVEATYSRSMGSMRLYQLVPLEGRRSGVPTPNAEVDTHGANLPALVWFLRKNNTAAWLRVIEAMQRIMPELTDIKTDFTTDRRLELQFAERGVRRPWSAEDVSDGTIQSLGMYTAIFDPRASMILIEEPENSVHPWIIRNFVDACREADRQIILTTHSPALLSYLNPGEINLVWKRRGRTQVEPLPDVDPTVETMWREGKVSLAEVIDSGLLPQSVPGGEG